MVNKCLAYVHYSVFFFFRFRQRVWFTQKHPRQTAIWTIRWQTDTRTNRFEWEATSHPKVNIKKFIHFYVIPNIQIYSLSHICDQTQYYIVQNSLIFPTEWNQSFLCEKNEDSGLFTQVRKFTCHRDFGNGVIWLSCNFVNIWKISQLPVRINGFFPLLHCQCWLRKKPHIVIGAILV